MSCIIETTTTDDAITCILTVKAPLQRVWEALTTREGWSGWFSEDVESDFQLGSIMRLDFGSMGQCWGTVAERHEHKSFAYRWHPGEDCDMDKYPGEEMTTVRFEIETVEGGTKIVMTESGFTRIAEDRRFNALRLNTDGWKEELEEMAAWLDSGTVQKFLANSVKRERIYKASPETAWEAVATAKGLEGWFCKSAEGKFAPGELIVLTFDMNEEIIEGPLKVVTYNPITEFSYRWHPGRMEGAKWEEMPESQATLVTMTVTPIDGGAHLAIVETGFENVAEDYKSTALALNRQGWTECMDMIGAYVDKG